MTRQYAEAGVDLEGAEAAKARIARAVATTRTPLSAGQVGAFGGMVRVPAGMTSPVLVMSTDGVGTKVMVAREAGRWDTVGEDLVNHSVNDILVHGATPIAFMDYLAGAALSMETQEAIVEGVARGCRAHGMALAGGETAQMPGLYRDGDFDLAGTIIGVVEETEALHGDSVQVGDQLLAYGSSGLHTNGYTLARRVLFETLGKGLDDHLPETGTTVAEALLAVHRSYHAGIMPIVGHLHALAHITGGGIPGNLIRILPEGCEAVVRRDSWGFPPLFTLIQDAGGVAESEMLEVFNCGVGMIAVVPPESLEAVRAAATSAGDDTWLLGEIRQGSRAVRFAGAERRP